MKREVKVVNMTLEEYMKGHKDEYDEGNLFDYPLEEIDHILNHTEIEAVALIGDRLYELETIPPSSEEFQLKTATDIIRKMIEYIDLQTVNLSADIKSINRELSIAEIVEIINEKSNSIKKLQNQKSILMKLLADITVYGDFREPQEIKIVFDEN